MKSFGAQPRWCINELNLTRRLNKLLFGIPNEEWIAVGNLPRDVIGTRQLPNLAQLKGYCVLGHNALVRPGKERG